MMIDLYTWTTPNGRKISIALEEMGLPYAVHKINIAEDEQFSEAFLALSPNNKIPAIYDNGHDVSVFESGAILIYLAEISGKFIPNNIAERAKVLEWLNWQIAGFGPMLGQLNYFINRADTKMPEAIKRFTDETLRLYRVLDTELGRGDYVAGTYSIADMAIYPWSVAAYDVIKTRTDTKFDNVERWHNRVSARPAVIAGMLVPQA